MIENGKKVSVHYTGTLENGDVFDTSVDRSPLVFEFGAGQLIPGFESALVGKDKGDKVVADIEPNEGYGPIREELFVKVNKDKMPGNVEVGQVLSAAGPNGGVSNVTVKEVESDYVIIDANHPLAGQRLIFNIEVLDVE